MNSSRKFFNVCIILIEVLQLVACDPSLLQLFIEDCQEESAKALVQLGFQNASLESFMAGGYTGNALDDVIAAMLDTAVVLNKSKEFLQVIQLASKLEGGEKLDFENTTYNYLNDYSYTFSMQRTNMTDDGNLFRGIDSVQFEQVLQNEVQIIQVQAQAWVDYYYTQPNFTSNFYYSLQDQAQFCAHILQWEQGLDCYSQQIQNSTAQQAMQKCLNEFLDEAVVGEFVSGGPISDCLTIPSGVYTNGTGWYDMFDHWAFWLKGHYQSYLTPIVLNKMMQDILELLLENGSFSIINDDQNLLLQSITMELIWALRIQTRNIRSHRGPHMAVSRGIARGLSFLTQDTDNVNVLQTCEV
eukprot:TRINITY_DN18804_c0_g1_i3.p1 TRINITY_DN18804_c0_g1~~TRINITY_DN18804_c0_g1_i3.p1  ORF type:complete len:356 (+),score=15.18 TRINITY_DN18804_c0_g1_i3:308-1375(+)